MMCARSAATPSRALRRSRPHGPSCCAPASAMQRATTWCQEASSISCRWASDAEWCLRRHGEGWVLKAADALLCRHGGSGQRCSTSSGRTGQTCCGRCSRGRTGPAAAMCSPVMAGTRTPGSLLSFLRGSSPFQLPARLGAARCALARSHCQGRQFNVPPVVTGRFLQRIKSSLDAVRLQHGCDEVSQIRHHTDHRTSLHAFTRNARAP